MVWQEQAYPKTLDDLATTTILAETTITILIGLATTNHYVCLYVVRRLKSPSTHKSHEKKNLKTIYDVSLNL